MRITTLLLYEALKQRYLAVFHLRVRALSYPQDV